MAKSSSFTQTFAMLAWVLSRKGGSVAEIAEHFQVSEKTVRDLVETIGNAYFGQGMPDEEIGLDWDEFYAHDYVLIRDYHGVGKRLGLSQDETVALILGLHFLSHLLPQDMSDAAATVAIKLLRERNLGIDLSRVSIIDYEGVGELGRTIQTAIRAKDAIQFEYVNAHGQDASKQILPIRLAQLGGHWIVHGHEQDSGMLKSYRLDRMSGLEVITSPGPTQAFTSEEKPRSVVVGVSEDSLWAAQGRAKITKYRGIHRATYQVYDRRWLENQLLLLGGAVRDCTDIPALQNASNRAVQATENRDLIRQLLSQ